MTTPRSRPRRSAAPRADDRATRLKSTVLAALDDMKAVNVKVLDVKGLTDIADLFIIASGNSDRHVRSIADRVAQKCKEAGQRPYGVEGARDGEWVLVDLHDIVVHVMLPRVREFYSLERLWEAAIDAGTSGSAAGTDKPASRAKRPGAKTAGAKTAVAKTAAAKRPKSAARSKSAGPARRKPAPRAPRTR